jgi:hypothetical protein
MTAARAALAGVTPVQRLEADTHRFHLLRWQTRLTYWLALGWRVIQLTVFCKIRSAETAEAASARTP